MRNRWAWLALAATLSATLLLWYTLREHTLEAARDKLEREAGLASASLEANLSAHEQFLRGLAALAAVAPARREPASWHGLTRTLQSKAVAADLSLFGYAEAALAAAAAPGGATDEGITIAFSSAAGTASVQRLFAENPGLRRTLARAVQSTQLGVIAVPRAQASEGAQAEILLTVPALASDGVRGIAFATIDAARLSRAALAGVEADALGVQLSDRDSDGMDTVLYERVLPQTQMQLVSSRALTLGGHTLTVQLARGPLEGNLPLGSLLAGTLASLLLFAGIRAVSSQRCVAELERQRFLRDMQESEERYRHLAHHDALTGLPNRTFLQEHVAAVLARARRQQTTAALLFIDLDRFKNINDTLGHDTGDQILKLAARRIESSVRAEDLVARVGADEFVVVIADLKGSADAATVARHILKNLGRPCVFSGHELLVTPSIGISVSPQDGEDLDALLKNAHTAMYAAKSHGRNNSRFFSAVNADAGASRRLALEAALHHALERAEFELYYQPQVELWSGKVVAVEALLRWKHPERGIVSPGEFIPIAEETGLIVPIGEWVLGEACRQLAAWKAKGLPPMRLAVNISARQLKEPDIALMVAQILGRTGVAAPALELELTETGLLQDTQAAIAALRQFKEIGVQVVMDDFGTGYSSLSYLRGFPIDKIKIDRTFVRDITVDPNDAALVRALIDLAHSLGMRIAAEGVESAEQLEFLRRHRSDEAQGYVLAKPLPANELEKLIATWKRPANWTTALPALSAVG